MCINFEVNKGVIPAFRDTLGVNAATSNNQALCFTRTERETEWPNKRSTLLISLLNCAGACLRSLEWLQSSPSGTDAGEWEEPRNRETEASNGSACLVFGL